VKKRTGIAAAANSSTNRNWIYLLTTERHRWQPAAGARLIIFQKIILTTLKRQWCNQQQQLILGRDRRNNGSATATAHCE
jgi:hypothetical protein